ncbi:MAG: PEP-CTERM sorting domain-containing protein [Verrucomicrobia bacterium]|nr:PEP-CTERM sorting domain-containing protein [Verrucomicrobiota bacterium]
MQPIKTKLFPIAIAIALCFAASAQADVPAGNFWHNPTFEAGTPGIPPETGTPDNWNRGGADASILHWSTGNSVSSSHSLGVVKPVAGAFGEWYSDFAIAGFASAGDVLALHWHEMFNISGGEMRLTLRLLDGGGGGPNSGDHHFVVSGNSSGWVSTLADSSFTTRNELSGGNAGLLGPIVVAADTVYVRLQLVSGGGDSTIGSYLIDDLSVSVVPEPTSIALLGMGALVGVNAIRRRRMAR